MNNSASHVGIDGIHLKCMQWRQKINHLYVIKEAIQMLYMLLH